MIKIDHKHAFMSAPLNAESEFAKRIQTGTYHLDTPQR